MVSGKVGAHETSGRAVLDLQHLGKYTAGDETLRHELLSLFGEQLAHQLSTLQGECQGDDWTIATHTLKGAARAVGAFKIAETAAALEQLDPNSDPEHCANLIDQLVQQAQECKTVIQELSKAA